MLAALKNWWWDSGPAPVWPYGSVVRGYEPAILGATGADPSITWARGADAVLTGAQGDDEELA